uniref:Uncharacterized protein n=1 Tax=Caenorhabditis japonica TaxID=281687 RepID=A0A8R1HYZ6_CAEJA
MKLNEEFEEPKASDDPEEQLAEQYKLTEDDKDFIKSIKKFKANNFGSAKTPVEKKNVKVTLSAKDQKKEEEILGKLRSKYGNKNSKQRKPPIIIDAPSLNQKKSTTLDIQNKEPIEEKEPWLINLIKSWFTSETRKMIREGARPSGGAAEQLFRDFMAGKKVDAEKQVNLPNLDKYNIKEKRLNVFLHSIRNQYVFLFCFVK